MRVPRTLWLYLLREVGLYALVGFLAIALILVASNVPRQLELLIAARFAPSEVGDLLACLFAMFAPLAVPMGFLVGTLLGIGRLSSDNEIAAMEGSGLGLSAVLVPVLAAGIAISAASAYLVIRVEPAAKRRLRAIKVEVASRGAGLEAGEFAGYLDDRVLFVQSVDRDRLSGVVISDRSDAGRPLLILAERGRLAFDAERAEMRLLLESGEIHLEPTELGDEAYRRWSFDTFDYALDVSPLLERYAASIKPSEMTFGELRSALARHAAGDPLADLREKDPVAYRIQIQRRLAIPMAPVLFALIGVPLGLRGGRGARATGILLSVALFFAYYMLMTFGESLAEEGLVGPAVAMWSPNAAFAVAAVPLLRRAARGGG